jgi:hypothetical protein
MSDNCPRCAHRPHAPHGCEARYHVTFEADEPGDPCLCPEAALPACGTRYDDWTCQREKGHAGAHWAPSAALPEPAPAADGEPRTTLDALVDALYKDGCLAAPRTDHTLHVIASLQRQGFRIEPEPAPGLDGAGVVLLLRSVGNTLAGWMRHMEGYGDDALAKAIDFVIEHPDLEERIEFFRNARLRWRARHPQGHRVVGLRSLPGVVQDARGARQAPGDAPAHPVTSRPRPPNGRRRQR